MKKRLVVLGVILLVALGAFGVWRYEHSFQTVSITMDPLVKSAGITPAQEKEHNALPAKPVKTLSSSQEVKLKKGDYIVGTRASGDLAAQTINIVVANEKVSLTISPDYSDRKLADMLGREQASIDQAFGSKYPSKPAGYVVSKEKLFKRGEWFGALLKPASPDQDTLRFVMQKKDGKWVVVTDPPEIILSSIIYPGIPKDVLQTVNSF